MDNGNNSPDISVRDKDKWQEWLVFTNDLERRYNLDRYGDFYIDKIYLDYNYDKDGFLGWKFHWDLPDNAKLEIAAYFRENFITNM